MNSRDLRAGVLAVFTMCPASVWAVDPTCKPPANNDWSAWLNQQEAAGGHTKACHLGVATNGLIGRLTDRGGNNTGVCTPGNAASAWSSPSTLQNIIKPIVTAHWDEVNRGPDGNHIYTGSGATTLGTTVKQYTGAPG